MEPEKLSDIDESTFLYKETYLPITELDMWVAGFPKHPTQEDLEGENGTVYTLNSEFFRSPEFEQVDLITLGCSQTFGQGVDDEVIWPRVLAESLGISYANLAMPASSVQAMFSSLMVYIRRYGKPKYVAALLPGYRRISVPLRHEYNTSSNTDLSNIPNNAGFEILNLAYREDGFSHKEIPMYSKRPYILDEILAYEVPLHQSMFSLAAMIEYCKIADIKLFFSTWNSGMNDLIITKQKHEMTEVDLSGYISLPLNTRPKTCHSEEAAKYQDTWDMGRDSAPHMGVHDHLHYAEIFERAIRDGQ